MASNFCDLLQRADKLSNSIESLSKKSVFGGKQKNAGFVIDGIEPNLDQIFRRGESLWKNTTNNIDISVQETALHANMVLGSEGLTIPPFPTLEANSKSSIFDDLKVNSQKEAPRNQLDNHETDLGSFLRQKRDQMLTDLVDETLKNTMNDAERLHWRQMVQDWEDHKKDIFKGIPTINVSEMIPKPASSRLFNRIGSKHSPMTDIELAFASRMNDFIESSVEGGRNVDLTKSFAEIAKDTAMKDIWEQVQAVLDTPVTFGMDLSIQRSSTDWAISHINQSTCYLETQFLKHMEMVVCGNLQQARRGGIPGTLALVQAYLNVRFSTPYKDYQYCCPFEDGLIDNRHPVWTVVYYCLRSGSKGEARRICEQMKLNDVATALRHLEINPILPSEILTKISLDYRRTVRSQNDPFKQAVYCLLGNCDDSQQHTQVADKLEDWLWFQLSLAGSRMSRDREIEGEAGEMNPLEQLQSQVAYKFGEAHFSSSHDPLTFWTALWLSGQLESAIDYLCRQGDDLKTNAVHIAIAAYQVGLLLTPVDSRQKLLSSEPNDNPRIRRLNIARLVMLYTAKFESSDPKDSLNYLYLLRTLKLTPISHGDGHANEGVDNLFEAGVARLVEKMEDCQLLLGTIDDRGHRKQGLIDRFKLNTRRIIEHVARKAECAFDFHTASALYDLASCHSDTIRLLNSQLSQVISQTCSIGSQCELIRKQALSIASRYKKQGCKAPSHLSATLYLLLDFGTFFDLYHEDRLDESVQVLRKLDCLPMNPDQVDQKVKIFHMIPEEVRRVLADILLALMNICVEQYKRITQGISASRPMKNQMISDIRQQAQAVILFTGMIPYRLPADANGRLMQMQAFLN